MQSQASQFCSKCLLERPINDFQINKQGKRQKGCYRHSKKRALPEPDIDQWDDLIYEITCWSKPGQKQRLELSYCLSLHQLPTSFEFLADTSGKEIEDYGPLNEAINQLSYLIREAGGHRFRMISIAKNENIIYYYRCSQDIGKKPETKEIAKRDRHQMDRIPCEGKLSFQINLQDRLLNVKLTHSYHKNYTDVHLSPMILAFISTRCSTKTPGEIYRELQSSRIDDADKVAQHQVSYQWHQKNESTWRHDSDPFVSATRFLESKREYQNSIYTIGNIRGLGIYIRGTMNVLFSKVSELAIDATYGTNSSGMDLFVVLAELDGTGVPLGYLLTAVDARNQSSRLADAGAMTCILEQFLQPIKSAGFMPKFFHCDKDKSEISAIKKIWPEVTIRLCYWHAKRAIRNKLRENKKTRSQNHYHPNEAKALVPRLEICWGSYSTRRPGDHQYGRCECNSSKVSFEESGSIETSTVSERDIVLVMFSRHFNMHSMIPDQNGTYRSAEQIHSDCINEIYAWCHSRNYFRLWAYLFVNWYAPDQWKLWARSASPSGISVLKTTMIVESHWRRIKHDYLHRYNRPRMDLVVSILTSLVVPEAVEKMNAILSKNFRKATAAWRKVFKKHWDDPQHLLVVRQDLLKYHTDPIKWTCACNGFLLSRFLLCKHVRSCYEEISDRTKFFCEIRRQRESPFWVHQHLSLRPEWRDIFSETQSQTGNELCSDSGPDSDTDFSENGISNLEETGNLDSSDEMSQSLVNDLATRNSIDEIINHQKSIGNARFLKEYFKGRTDLASDKILLDEITRIKRLRTMPTTWTRYKHPAAAYYK